MNSQQITLVETSFAHALPVADAVAVCFYDRLFEIAPELRTLFPQDMTEQRRKLMQMLAMVVKGLRDLDRLVPVAMNLGKRHAGYGVQDSHYQTVGAALLWTLAQSLGELFTPEVEDAWTVAYTLLAGTMQAGAEQVALDRHEAVVLD